MVLGSFRNDGTNFWNFTIEKLRRYPYSALIMKIKPKTVLKAIIVYWEMLIKRYFLCEKWTKVAYFHFIFKYWNNNSENRIIGVGSIENLEEYKRAKDEFSRLFFQIFQPASPSNYYCCYYLHLLLGTL